MMVKAQANGYSIGEAARAAGLSAKTIRYYEQIGLIPRAQRRAGAARTGGDRVYSEADLGRLRFIRHARMVDLGLTDIRELLRGRLSERAPGLCGSVKAARADNR